jgi:translocation and assembly module TamB
LKRVIKWTLILLAVLLVLAAAALVLADTAWGHRQIISQIEAQRPKSGLRIKIQNIEGSIYGEAKVRGLALSDPKGTFLTVPLIDMVWKPLAWFSNRLEVKSLRSDQATLLRLPKLIPSKTKRPILPGFDIDLGEFRIGKLIIEPAVAGERRVGSANGKLLTSAGRAKLSLAVDAALGDRLSILLDAEPEQDKFDLEASISAPAGGVIGAIAGTAKPITVSITGDGSWTRWQGFGRAAVAGIAAADLTLLANEGQFGLNGRLSLESITRGKIQSLTGPVVNVNGKATLQKRRLSGSLFATSPALSVLSTGTVDLARNSFDNLLLNARLLQPAKLFPNMTGENVALKARLNGSFGVAAFDYLLTAPRVAFGLTGLEQVRASGQGRLSKWPVTLPIKLSAARITGIGQVAGGILNNATIDGSLRITPLTIISDDLKLRSDKLSGRLQLLVDLKTGTYDVGLLGQLLSYYIPGLGIVDVKSDLRIVPGVNGKGTRVVGTGEARVRRFDNAFLAGLAGGLPVLTTALERGVDGVMRFANLRIIAPRFSFVGGGMRRLDGSLVIEGGGNQGEYGPFRLTLDGVIDRPKLDILLARPADGLGLASVRLLLDPNTNGFAFRSAGQSSIGAFTSSGQLFVPKRGAVIIDIAEIRTSGVRATGRLTATEGGLIGRMTLAGGGMSGTLDLSRIRGLQAVEAHVKARDARLDGPPLITARRAKFDGLITLDPKGVMVEGTLTGQGLSRGDLSLARLAANIRLRGGAGEIRAAFAGSRGRSFDLQTIAQVSPNRWQVIGSGTIDRKPAALSGPAVLTREGNGWRLAPAELSFAGGKARLTGLFGDNASEVDATLSQMPLAILDMFSPNLGLGGVANGSLVYRQPQNGPASGKADLKIRGLTRAGLVLASQPIDMGVAATLSGNSAGVRMIAVSGGREIGRAQAKLTPSGQGSLIQQLSTAGVFGQIRYSGPADALWRLSGVETLDVAGPIALGADVTGRVSDPVIRGTIRATGARIESPATGMVLTGVNAVARFGNGSKLVLDSLSANAGQGGRVTGSGVIDLAASRGFSMDVALEANQAVLLARDDFSATLTGLIRLNSNGSEGIISGDVMLNKSQFRLGRMKAVQALPRLNVREINGRDDDAAPSRPIMPWRLAIKARAQNRLAVTGLGLDSEWRADLDIAGTPYAPVIRGRADMLRGQYEFAGRQFSVSRGVIRFQGESPPDPVIDIVAEGSTQGVNATIRVSGTGQRPEIRFASTPSLPEDELLSRLLFGTSITNLSAPEALQLAGAVASLRSGGDGLNPINALRKAIGLDRLRILPADAVTGQGTSVAAGKYLTRRAYVEIVTDGQGYSATRAEFQITRFLSILGTLSTIGRQSISGRISKDY